MDQEQRELRRAAAQAFIESLDKLQETLCASEANNEVVAAPQGQLVDFEKAVEDIEQFMEAKQEETSSSDT